MELAPIILFVYNRPWHTERTLQALKLNHLANQSKLYVYCDGPKADASEETRKKIDEVRALVANGDWCKEVILRERAENRGLAANVIEGITEVINEHGRVIVLEDDLITAPYFLTYCNEGLDLYKDVSNVYSINGYQFPMQVDEADTFLSPQATSSWGWATWKDRWEHFEIEATQKDTIVSSDHLTRRFNLADYNYVGMLNNKNSWAIRWYYTAFLRNGLGLFPTQTLVENIGFDGSGEHCSIVDYEQRLWNSKIELSRKDKINISYYKKTLDFFSEAKKTSQPVEAPKSHSALNYFSKIFKKKA
jgi:hypothetical protein